MKYLTLILLVCICCVAQDKRVVWHKPKRQPTLYPLRVTTTSLPSGVVGQPYHALICATGGTMPYNWKTIIGQLPAGLSLQPTTDFHGRCIAIDGVPQ